MTLKLLRTPGVTSARLKTLLSVYAIMTKRSRSGKENQPTSGQRRRGVCQASRHKRADSLRQDDAKHESERDRKLVTQVRIRGDLLRTRPVIVVVFVHDDFLVETRLVNPSFTLVGTCLSRC